MYFLSLKMLPIVFISVLIISKEKKNLLIPSLPDIGPSFKQNHHKQGMFVYISGVQLDFLASHMWLRGHIHSHMSIFKHLGLVKCIFVICTNQMFGSLQKSVEQKPLKDANFPSVYLYVCICLHASGGRCAKTELSSYGLCETENKRCSSCILTTKSVTQTNYYDSMNKDA